MPINKSELNKSALIIVDMQNDFLNPEGSIGKRSIAKESPNTKPDLQFMRSIIPNISKLIKAFRKTRRPVIYIAHVLKADYSDAAFPYWLFNPHPGNFLVEGSWGAQVIDELKPKQEDFLVVKKGYNAFSNTPLNTILGNLNIKTCIITGVTTSVCVSSTIRGGVEYNYRMILVRDATAEVNKELHESEIKILARSFAGIAKTSEILTVL